jgi:hypothetical chaperone protein
VSTAAIDLSCIAPDLKVSIDRLQSDRAIAPGVKRVEEAIIRTVSDANLSTADIQAVFLTGGSAMIPFIRNKISVLFKAATIVEGDMFGSVGKGLGLDAHRKFR